MASRPFFDSRRRPLNAISWVRLCGLLSLLATAPAAADNPLAGHVRAANDRFKDVKIAIADGYAPIPCACAHAHPMT
jgi:hypothetical protein